MSVIFTKEGSLALVTINREKALNAPNTAVLERLEEIFFELEEGKEVKEVIITGAGEKAFVVGADVQGIKEAGDRRTELIRRGQEVLSKIRNSTKIVMAAVNRFAPGGGCELAMACDIRFASENAQFGLPKARLGLMAGYGGTQLLPRLAGVGIAKYMIFSGAMITANQALQWGLVQKICKAENLIQETTAVAKQISSNGPFAIKSCKLAIDRGVQLSLDDAPKLELQLYNKVAHSTDAEEGLAAFLEKRVATFEGS